MTGGPRPPAAEPAGTEPGPPTDAHGLVARAEAFGVSLALADATALLAYLDAMLALNEQINLTAVRDREAAIVLHVLDSLAFARTGLRPAHALDLGSGNGFPGVAVALLHRRASVVLLDRTGKKVRAIGTCLLTAKIDGIETLQFDAAQLPARHRELRRAFDLVTARAVGQPELVGSLAAPLLRPGGHLVLWLDAGTEARDRLDDLRLLEQIAYDLPAPQARARRLAVYRR